MLARAFAVWFTILVLAFANGTLREMALIPAVGEIPGRAISSLILSAAVLLVSWVTIAWMRPRSNADAWSIGALWVTLTLAFEFLAGHYVFGNPWSRLFAEYNLLAGRIWILVLVTTAIAPLLAARAHGLFTRAAGIGS